jgi:hypothetical protein
MVITFSYYCKYFPAIIHRTQYTKEKEAEKHHYAVLTALYHNSEIHCGAGMKGRFLLDKETIIIRCKQSSLLVWDLGSIFATRNSIVR